MSEEPKKPCPDCAGVTLQFSGFGSETQYRLCPLWKEPGHLSEDEVREKLRLMRKSLYPSGRFA